MKALFAITASLFLLSSAPAQEINIHEPEFTGIILLVKDSNTSEKLEKQKASTGTKADVGAALFGIAKGKGMNIVTGASSPVRVENGEKVKLIVKVKENDRDPMEVINVFRLEQDLTKDKRVVIVGTVNFNKTSSANIDFIPFDATKYGASSYLVELSNLSSGEYALTLDGSRDVFNLFGVD
jgi:hypothetical protein